MMVPLMLEWSRNLRVVEATYKCVSGSDWPVPYPLRLSPMIGFPSLSFSRIQSTPNSPVLTFLRGETPHVMPSSAEEGGSGPPGRVEAARLIEGTGTI